MSDSIITYIPIAQIVPTDNNCRAKPERISELSESIERVGLLQNITVRRIDHDCYMVVSGSRRFAAIQLLNQKSPGWDMVPCLVIDDRDTMLVNLAENSARVEIPIWRVGFRVSELITLGMTQREIARSLGKSPAWVSTAKEIGDGIHPDIIIKLDTIGSEILTMRILRSLVMIPKTPDGEPDYEAQLKFLTSLVRNVSKRKPRGRHAGRVKKLEQLAKSNPDALVRLTEVLDYMKGIRDELGIR
jgi:ParB/RepB/Spo0J family partition protein